MLVKQPSSDSLENKGEGSIVGALGGFLLFAWFSGGLIIEGIESIESSGRISRPIRQARCRGTFARQRLTWTVTNRGTECCKIQGNAHFADALTPQIRGTELASRSAGLSNHGDTGGFRSQNFCEAPIAARSVFVGTWEREENSGPGTSGESPRPRG